MAKALLTNQQEVADSLLFTFTDMTTKPDGGSLLFRSPVDLAGAMDSSIVREKLHKRGPLTKGEFPLEMNPIASNPNDEVCLSAQEQPVDDVSRR